MTTTIPLNYTEQFFVAKQSITQQQDNIICQLQLGTDLDEQRLIDSFHATLQEIDTLWVNLSTMPGHMTSDPAACTKQDACVRILGEVQTQNELEQLRQEALASPLLQKAPHIHLDIIKYDGNYVLLLATPHMLLDGIANYLFLSSWFNHYQSGTKPEQKFSAPIFQHTSDIYNDFSNFLPELKNYYQSSKLLSVPDHAFDDSAVSQKLNYVLPAEFEADLKNMAKIQGSSFEVTLLATITRTIRELLGSKEFCLRYNRHGRRLPEQRSTFRFLLEDPILKINTQNYAIPHLINNIQSSLDFFDGKPRVPHFMAQSLIMEAQLPHFKQDVAALMQSLKLPASTYVKPDIMSHYGYLLKNIQQAIKPPEHILVHVNITPSIFLAKQYANKAKKSGIELQSISFDFNHAKFHELHIFFTKDIDNQWRLFTKGPIKHTILKDIVQMILSEIRSKSSDVILEKCQPYPKPLSA